MIPDLTELFEKTQRSVTHLVLRDTYGTSGIGYRAWRDGVPIEEIRRYDHLLPWVEMVRGHVKRGVSFRRARVVSEPLSDYMRYEHAITPAANLRAGEQVRWLPRTQAYDLALPGCDFWQFDDELVCFVFQSGDGEPTGFTLIDDNPALSELCSTAFDAVWRRARDHGFYTPDLGSA
ncbi:DUF6879 family protein [Sphaerisporangium aureirubrum]|uniref:DUF6879 family protein n=1 Tax=Sphaerisporangium aureirubrum TaxID=1544736 RepID=UPI0036284E59